MKADEIEQDPCVKELVNNIGINLQQLENYLQRQCPRNEYLKTTVKIEFPKGYIRKC
ncbi:hypothetical protein ES705_44441 [subsurface metagenome]